MTNTSPWWEKSKATAFPAFNGWLNFHVWDQFEIKILIEWLINTTYFLCILEKLNLILQSFENY